MYELIYFKLIVCWTEKCEIFFFKLPLHDLFDDI